MKSRLILLLGLSLILGCGKDPQPKPKGFLALNYKEATYAKAKIDCPFTFEKNTLAKIKQEPSSPPCWMNLDYSNMDAKIYLTYYPVKNNLRQLLIDAQKLPEKHTIKADFIEASIYENPDKQTFGNFYEVEGDAASQAQFYLTDSTTHFVTGAIYFEAKPNYDSILPAAAYLKKDIRHLIESLKWK